MCSQSGEDIRWIHRSLCIQLRSEHRRLAGKSDHIFDHLQELLGPKTLGGQLSSFLKEPAGQTVTDSNLPQREDSLQVYSTWTCWSRHEINDLGAQMRAPQCMPNQEPGAKHGLLIARISGPCPTACDMICPMMTNDTNESSRWDMLRWNYSQTRLRSIASEPHTLKLQSIRHHPPNPDCETLDPHTIPSLIKSLYVIQSYSDKRKLSVSVLFAEQKRHPAMRIVISSRWLNWVTRPWKITGHIAPYMLGNVG